MLHGQYVNFHYQIEREREKKNQDARNSLTGESKPEYCYAISLGLVQTELK
jgi:hypothetical protein